MFQEGVCVLLLDLPRQTLLLASPTTIQWWAIVGIEDYGWKEKSV
jgi:hypothetical protein